MKYQSLGTEHYRNNGKGSPSMNKLSSLLDHSNFENRGLPTSYSINKDINMKKGFDSKKTSNSFILPSIVIDA